MKKKSNDVTKSVVVSEADKLEQLIKSGDSFFRDVNEYISVVSYLLDNERLCYVEKLIRYATQQHPTSISLQLLKVQMLLKKGKVSEAFDIATLCVEVDRSNTDSHFMLASCYLADNNISFALNCFQSAISFAYQEDRELYFLIGQKLSQYGFQKEAQNFFQHALSQDPGCKASLAELAVCCSELEQYDEAVKYFNLALDVDPFDKYVWCQFGMMYNEMQHFDEAIEAYEFATAIDPFYETALFNLANSLSNSDRIEEAIAFYLEYIELNSDDVLAYEYLADCYSQIDEITEALAMFAKALSLDNKSISCLYSVATILISEERYEEAIEYLEQVIALDPHNIYYQVTLGNVLITMDDFEKAENYLRNSVQQSPSFQDNWISLATFYGSYQKERLSVTVLERALQTIGPSAKIYSNMAAYCFILDNSEQAYKYLRMAHKIDPKECYCMFDNFDLGEDQIRIMNFVEDLSTCRIL